MDRRGLDPPTPPTNLVPTTHPPLPTPPPPLSQHAAPPQGAHPHWGSLVYNYGRNKVQNYLISNAPFWLHKYPIDGLPVAAGASTLYPDSSRQPGEWVPNQFGGRENIQAIDF